METDEEYIDAFRAWWKKYGLIFIILTVAFAAAYLGGRYYDSSKAAYRSNAANLYQEVNNAIASAQELRAAGLLKLKLNNEAAVQAAEQVKEQYPELLYNIFSSLYLARNYVVDGDLEAAITELDLALGNEELVTGLGVKSAVAFQDIIRLRIARLQLALGKYQLARAMLATLESDQTIAQAAEIRGDAFVAEGDFSSAAIAYRAALKAPAGSSLTPYVNWKLLGLADPELQTIPIQLSTDSEGEK